MKRFVIVILLLLWCDLQACLVRPLFKRPAQGLVLAGLAAHAVSWHYAKMSKKIVPAGIVSPRNKKEDKKAKEQKSDAEVFEVDLASEKFKHELIAEVSRALGSALLLFAGNYVVMSQLARQKKLPPFNKRHALIAFGNILASWSGVQFCLLPYGICKFLVLSPEWVKFLADPAGKVQLKERLRKMIANKINKKEDSKIVKMATRLAHAALMKDLDLDAEYIEVVAKKRARQYYWAMVICLEWAMLSGAYLACVPSK